jgi:hypothetical protein
MPTATIVGNVIDLSLTVGGHVGGEFAIVLQTPLKELALL